VSDRQVIQNGKVELFKVDFGYTCLHRQLRNLTSVYQTLKPGVKVCEENHIENEGEGRVEETPALKLQREIVWGLGEICIRSCGIRFPPPPSKMEI
jgi:hypothetical protein